MKIFTVYACYTGEFGEKLRYLYGNYEAESLEEVKGVFSDTPTLEWKVERLVVQPLPKER